MNLHDKDENLYEDKTIKENKEKNTVNEDNIIEEDNKQQETQEDNITEKECNEQEEIKEDKETVKVIEDANTHKSPKKSRKAILLISILLLVILLIISTGFALININNKKIILGISVNGINIGGLTEEEAIQKLTKEYETILKQDINITTTDFSYSITGEQIETQINIEETVEQAYKIGRDNNIFINNFRIAKALLLGEKIDSELNYNLELLETIVSDINSKIPNAMIDNSYSIEDDKLIITKGTEGNYIDIEELKSEIINAIKNKNYNITLNVKYKEPGEIDIEKIYNEVHKEAQNAYYTTDPFEIFPHVNGIDFDLEKAKELLKEDKDVYEIDLIITVPEITTNEIGTEVFPDLISSFSTKYDSSLKDRTTNLKLALAALDGTIVMPGETFSYNKTLGERTVAKGYKMAAGYQGGKVVQTLGGGICQISSTLYDAVVYANLEIAERHNHVFLTSYLGAGKDATVVYGSLDFKFKNTRQYPIVIKASANSGIAKIEIYGIKEEVEYEVEISTKVLSYISYQVIYEDSTELVAGQQKVTQNGMNGCKSITYKILKLNGVEVSRETLSTDTYSAMNKYITRGITETTIETSSPVQESTSTETEQNTNTSTETTNTVENETPATTEPTETENEVSNEAA